MNEARLTEKLKLIEALFSGATTEGEKDAAFNALQRIRSRLEEIANKVISESIHSDSSDAEIIKQLS